MLQAKNKTHTKKEETKMLHVGTCCEDVYKPVVVSTKAVENQSTEKPVKSAEKPVKKGK